MKKQFKKIFLIFVCLIIFGSLTGCTVGKYQVCEFFTDENGNRHFMLIGKHGLSGEGVEEINNLPKADSETSKSSFNSENITGYSLKRGWTSSDNSILKGKNVTVKEDSALFSINLAQDKEITISYNIELNSGEYQLVHIKPDGTEQQLLQDGKIIKAEEQVLFEKGWNKIAVIGNNAVFKKIDISVIGIDAADFK